MFGLGSLIQTKEGNLNDILDNSVLSGFFLFQYDNAPVHKARSIKKCISQFGVAEFDWSAQSPDLNPIQQLWDELEQKIVSQGPVSPNLQNVTPVHVHLRPTDEHVSAV